MEHLYRIITVLFTMLILFSVQSFHTVGNAAGTTVEKVNIQESVFLNGENVEYLFFTHAVEACYATIQLSKLAKEKTQNEYLKDIARTLEQEHKSWLKELSYLAHKNKIAIPSDMNKGDKVFMKYLGKQASNEFDKQWVSILIDKHDQFIGVYDRYHQKSNLKTPFKSWIKENIPHFQSHQDRLLMFEASLRFE